MQPQPYGAIMLMMQNANYPLYSSKFIFIIQTKILLILSENPMFRLIKEHLVLLTWAIYSTRCARLSSLKITNACPWLIKDQLPWKHFSRIIA
jgi:hypothetical protein